MNNLQKVLCVLKTLRDEQAKFGARWEYDDQGICSAFDLIAERMNFDVSVDSDLLDSYWHMWDKWSGSYQFPVPHPKMKHECITAFHTLPKWEGEYGELRKELLETLIKIIEGELNETSPS